MPSFSVITPSYNQGQFIGRTIDSVLGQGVDLEYWVIDGGSSDNTVEVLKSYGDRLRWVSEKDRGQADAVNKGILRTTGDVICWLNSDDVYYPGALSKVGAFFDARPEIDIVYGKAHHIGLHDEVQESYYTEEFDFERLKDVCFLCQPAVFFRRSVVERIGLIDADLNYCLDYEYWLRAGRSGCSFAHMHDYLAGSRMYDDNKTLSARVRVHAEINEMFRTCFGQVPVGWLSNYAHALVDSRNIGRDDMPRFVFHLAAATFFASLRWNRGVNAETRALLRQWLHHYLPRWLRGGR
ncbi:glycosyltransferase family 2 protein [Paramagnetospirillum magneticum]|uniref:Glycosyltransferase n=1 Tax=Paramagnetospirillum magneticum (strain ATCC 700264 / AMB-1) TaxID=342108 RepID=Q2W8E3_PARM1|nr:glycosyltransferase family 2 protein [Paramagnetospirillum magneticum]BAE49882.1 Glycosyltransferase [Paramagnetospirillum magneticum AMB-1]